MQPAQSLSSIVTLLLATCKRQHGVSLRQCQALFRRRTVAIGLFLFALANSLPISVPGVSTVTGIPIIILGVHLMVSGRKLWLPRRIAHWRLRDGKITHALERMLPYIRKVEKVVKPRWSFLSQPPASNVLGAVFALMGLLLVLPIPLTNIPIGLSITVIAIGFLMRDGITIVVGLTLSALVSIFVLSMLFVSGEGIAMLF